jgi:hypothetical protein
MLWGIGGCERYHHKLHHNDIPTGNHLEDDVGPIEPTQAELDSVNNIDTAYHVAIPGAISIQTLVCNITAKGANFKTVALVDSGSNITCIDEDYAKELKLTVLSTELFTFQVNLASLYFNLHQSTICALKYSKDGHTKTKLIKHPSLIGQNIKKIFPISRM